MTGVIALAGHQMTAAHVDPLYLREQMTELLLESVKHTRKVVAV